MRKNSRGFNLIELLIAVAIFSILVVMSIPSFNSLIARSRQHDLARALVETMMIARSEAIKHNMRVNACPSRDLRTCSGGDDWENGWIVYRAINETRNLDVEEEPLHVVSGGTFGNATARANQGLPGYVSYVGSGWSQRLTGARLMGTIYVCTPGQNKIDVIMSGGGRPRVERTNTSC
ncbi:MAG: GspH/FimT family pseudopilin [Burkholderiales bacterium]|jgi:type IV fimbrial biogenesis protein FimT|nr:GspH/FimT family pseudopilin [Burkholderiales bacterium]